MQIIVVLLMLHGIFIHPWILETIFNWYLADYFGKCMSYHHAMGLSIVFGFLTAGIPRKPIKDLSAESIVEFGIDAVILSWITFVFAWLLKGVDF